MSHVYINPSFWRDEKGTSDRSPGVDPVRGAPHLDYPADMLVRAVEKGSNVLFGSSVCDSGSIYAPFSVSPALRSRKFSQQQGQDQVFAGSFRSITKQLSGGQGSADIKKEKCTTRGTVR